MTDDILAIAKRALELDEKALHGPWTYKKRYNGFGSIEPDVVCDVVGGVAIDQCDGDFIAFSRSALPALAREVIRLNAALFDRTEQRDDVVNKWREDKEKLAIAVEELDWYANGCLWDDRVGNLTERARAALAKIRGEG